MFERFAELTKGKMALLISHRFSTVKMADRIVVLEKGQIAEEGRHEELMARGGRYAAMYKPFHLIGLELNVSVLAAALRGEPTGHGGRWCCGLGIWSLIHRGAGRRGPEKTYDCSTGNCCCWRR